MGEIAGYCSSTRMALKIDMSLNKENKYYILKRNGKLIFLMTFWDCFSQESIGISGSEMVVSNFNLKGELVEAKFGKRSWYLLNPLI